jgi:hypothetical protein
MRTIVSMRTLFVAACLAFSGGAVWAQASGSDQTQANDKSEHSTGRTVSPETKGQKQPQGWTGPLETTSGGAPASSPQGQSPPGMQAAPEGSSKTTVEPPEPDKK